MDQAPQPDAAAEIAHEERRADVQRRIEEVAGVLAETLLGMWRAKHRAERRFRELEARDELVANMLLEMTWFPSSELWLEPAGGKRTRVVLEHGRVVIGVAVLDEYGDTAVLRVLAVRATCRRQKHGRTLVEYIVDAPSNAFVFELTPTQTGRRVPRRSVPRSAVEALARNDRRDGYVRHVLPRSARSSFPASVRR